MFYNNNGFYSILAEVLICLLYSFCKRQFEESKLILNYLMMWIFDFTITILKVCPNLVDPNFKTLLTEFRASCFSPT